MSEVRFRPVKVLLVRGHTLAAEGQVVVMSEPPRAVCSCGELSTPLSSGGQRREWFRLHKMAVVAAREAEQQ